MSCIDKRIITNYNMFTQRCLVPTHLLKNSTIKPGDIVSINCGTRSIICRIFPILTSPLNRSLCIDDTVWYETNSEQKYDNDEKDQSLFPDRFTVLKTTVFERIQLKIILRNIEASYGQQKHNYWIKASKLIYGYTLRKHAIINCAGRETLSFHSIVVTDTYHEEDVCGRLSSTTKVEISEVVLEEQISLLNEIKNTEVGGLEEPNKLLSFYLFQKGTKRVIVSGPSGCGKSLFIKKFCSDVKCSLIWIDGMQKCDLTSDKCDYYYDYLTLSSVDGPQNHFSILFIDHIDKLVPSDMKQQSTFSNPLSVLVKLIKNLMHSKVLIIATVVQKKFIHPALSSIFQEEICMGIPSVKQRREILKVCVKNTSTSEIDFDRIARMIPGYIACDIVHLAENALKMKQNKVTSNEPSADNACLTTEDFEQAVLSVTPSILKNSKWSLKVKPVHWKDIGGMVKIKERLQLCIEKPLLHPEVFEKVDLHCPTGVLLFGPPGCCKTTLARGLATECNANFFAANPSQIYSAYVGESEKNISDLFYQARLCSPSIIFLDELDSLVGFRDMNTKQQGVAEKVLSTLLNEMDGAGIRRDYEENVTTDSSAEESDEDVVCVFDGVTEKNIDLLEKDSMRGKVIVVAATNRPDCIDNALLRSGRFDVILYVPPPNCEERESILNTITNGMPLQGIDFKEIAEKTQFFTGADLKNLCNMAAMNSLRQDMLNAKHITQCHFMHALKKLQPSITKEQVQMYEELSTKYGPVISE